MALGYQRIHDLSPLSLKLLNDQLEQLWKKTMGGIETRDMTQAVAATINAAVTEGRFTSMIRQYADEIRLMAGSGASDNLIRNGNAAFGTEGWEASGGELSVAERAAGGEAFLISGGGIARQGPFSLKAGAEYALCFAYRCEAGAWARVVAGGVEIARSEPEAASDWADHVLTFTPAEACEAVVELRFGGDALFAEVMLAEGGAGGWRQNPNEIKNSSITLTDERVAIDTRNFALKLYNAAGELITEMTADEQGFSSLYIAENMILRGKEFYLGDGDYHLWVHPDAPSAGARRILANNGAEPVSLEGCYPDIQEAIDAIPRWCDGRATVHIWGGGAFQYPSSRLVLSNFYGGGRIVLAPWDNATRYTLKRVEILNNSLVVDVQGAAINSCGAGDCFCVENTVAMLYDCRVNGNNLLEGSGSAGYDAGYGALAMLSACEAHNCHTAAHAHLGGRIFMEGCAGAGNLTGAKATTGGILQQSQSTFVAATPHFEGGGGKIIAQVTTARPGTTPAYLPLQFVKTYEARTTASLQNGGWVTSPDRLSVGPGATGAVWFDAEAIRADIGTRQVVHASITMRRRGDGGRAGVVGVSLRDLFSPQPSGLFSQGTDRGSIGGWRRGEKKTVAAPIAAADSLIRRGCNGFALTAGEEAVFEGVSERPPVLEIVYL